MISKTQIKLRIRKKTNPELQEVIKAALKRKSWFNLASMLSSSSRKQSSINLDEINMQAKEGDIIVIPGKVLNKGELTKKVRICALGISKSAKEKLKSTKSEFASISDEIHKNPKAEGIKIIK